MLGRADGGVRSVGARRSLRRVRRRRLPRARRPGCRRDARCCHRSRRGADCPPHRRRGGRRQQRAAQLLRAHAGRAARPRRARSTRHPRLGQLPPQLRRCPGTNPRPGSGSTVTAFIVDYYPPPTPYDGNPTWQAVNKALNADFQMIQVNSGDYPLKMATLIAGQRPPGHHAPVHGHHRPILPPGTTEFLKSQCQDLAPFLAGDAIKDYPNLAAIPT